MKRTIVKTLVLLFFLESAIAAQSVTDDEHSLRTFFAEYLDIYNRRFGHPDRSAQFRSELQSVVLLPLMQAPPSSAPRVVETADVLGRNFEGFVTQLEKKGVAELRWNSVELQMLSENKAIANNIGHGVDADGNVVYETVSVYLLYRQDGKWRIFLFSPYALDKRISLAGPGL